MARPIPWRQVVLSVGVAVVTLRRVSFADLRAAFSNLDVRSLYMAAFCVLALMVLRAHKWHCLMATVGNFRLRQSLRTLLGGCALGLITPGRVGELGRCIFVRKHQRTQVALLTLFDRTLDLWALLTLVGTSLFLSRIPTRRHFRCRDLARSPSGVARAPWPFGPSLPRGKTVEPFSRAFRRNCRGPAAGPDAKVCDHGPRGHGA